MTESWAGAFSGEAGAQLRATRVKLCFLLFVLFGTVTSNAEFLAAGSELLALSQAPTAQCQRRRGTGTRSR